MASHSASVNVTNNPSVPSFFGTLAAKTSSFAILLAGFLPSVVHAWNNLILGNPLKPILLGMAAGHLYYFLTVLYPLAGGSPASTEAQPSSSVQAQPNAAAQPNQANDGLAFRGRSYRLDDHQ
ncbi:hypothetical protein C3L33_03060, partial [Rhododendron williamsianum]